MIQVVKNEIRSLGKIVGLARCNGGLRILRTDYDERMTEMSSIGLWMGLSPLDIRICKFEMEH